MSLNTMITLIVLSGLLSSVASQITPENGGNGTTPDTAPSPTPTGPGDAIAGASGAGGGINISKGGLAAIIVVVVVVALIGIVSAVLFFVAKKRSWEVRKSIRRTARRFTSRQSSIPTRSSPQKDSSKKQPATNGTKQGTSSRAKVVDIEKGSPETKSSFEKEPAGPKSWRQKMGASSKNSGQ
ncbi:MAG: hypothetical protein M1814_003479 [Vezdaea aestivalis]|nr:MAG: hypothetical protein M1814_003479 [Vezdaea aestivalis]